MTLRVVELFAGVGGFRLGIQHSGVPHEFVWSNQWEPARKAQHASDCYVGHFGEENHSNEDITTVHAEDVPDHDLLVGGFPCQDYSVAATLDRSGGIEGKKGVLWWEIERIVRSKRPSFLLLENVDRLLRSPAKQRGRDFGVALWCLQNLGYRVEWRVINAADYGFPQRRRRVFVFAAHRDTDLGQMMGTGGADHDYLRRAGFFSRSFPVLDDAVTLEGTRQRDVGLPADLKQLSDSFDFHFQNAGVLVGRSVWTQKLKPKCASITPLSAVIEKGVDDRYYIPRNAVAKWKYFKGAKAEERTAKNGHRYQYKEGPVTFPDPLDQPSRTILTGEGGSSPSRSKHVIKDPETGRLRRLTPVECERLNGFPDGWTEGMPEGWRYFVMGNALVTGLVAQMLAPGLKAMRSRRAAVQVASRR